MPNYWVCRTRSGCSGRTQTECGTEGLNDTAQGTFGYYSIAGERQWIREPAVICLKPYSVSPPGVVEGGGAGALAAVKLARGGGGRGSPREFCELSRARLAIGEK